MKKISLFLLLCASIFAVSCDRLGTDTDKKGGYYYHNFFAQSVMDVYYLWNKEMKDDLYKWGIADNADVEPKAKVKSMRYQKDGKEYDHWTALYDEFSSFESSVGGVSTTYGCDIQLIWADSAKTTVYAVVTVVYPGSPAEAAGLKRGDILTSFNGRKMTADDYSDVLYNSFLYAASCNVTLYSGGSVSMTAVTMYEEPVLAVRTFDAGSKKIGYLAYNAFTLKSMETLYEACKKLRASGISELVLDLRYNGGGYVLAENLLASMLAPEAEVRAGSLFQRSVYNDDLTSALEKRYGDDACKTYFSFVHEWTEDSTQKMVNTSDANLGITKLYALVTSSTASASESILVGLKPYLDVEVIGEQTHGKFCSGFMISSEDWSEYITPASEAEKFKTATADWGIYVMVGTYADKNGANPCMPDGLVPDIKVSDSPYDGYQLGDENETMLKVALQRAGVAYPQTRAASVARFSKTPVQPHKAADGLRVIDAKAL